MGTVLVILLTLAALALLTLALLAALTLLVAESDADNKETMIRLNMNMLAHETETA